MDKAYNPQAIEQHWYQTWEQAGLFRPQGKDRSYCIVIPPPNVTGTLHMGHGFQMTLMDALTRYHRMQGDTTLWQMGTDHAGIATQMVVERQLAANGQTRQEIGREAFIDKVVAWQQQSGGTINQQLRRMGTSVDWQRARFTMDTGMSTSVRAAFIKLYNEGLIYRGKRLVNWDPTLATAISDLEVVNTETQGELWTIRYAVVDGSGDLAVATTRPETLFGDAAVAVHPDDERYKTLIGKQVHLPLTNRIIPIVGDTYVDPTFGTGVLKITPGHDFNDYAVGQRHNLRMLNILTADARLNGEVPAAYQGLDRDAARQQVITDLQAKGLLIKSEPHVHSVPRGDRSGTIIEPMLTDQWFLMMKPLAKPAIDAVTSGALRFVPEGWQKTYLQWLENIEDWCISRQLWWGHRIPAWYDQEGIVYVGECEADVRKKFNLTDQVQLVQDEDVLDTWFSASLWPFSTLGWPEKTQELARFYPTDVLVTGFDIIFFWVARMVMMGLKFTGKVPFKEVYITGLIRDSEGQKMSKSKGNTIDPIDLVDGISLDALTKKRTSGMMQPAMADRVAKQTAREFPEGIAAHGTDALRFTFCALASTGRDIRFDIGRLEGYRNFCNKLWNAARFVLSHIETQPAKTKDAPSSQNLIDRWIQSRLQKTILDVHKAFLSYRFDLLATAIYEFTWNEFCDWYLELCKPVLMSSDAQQKQLTCQCMLTILESLLRLAHPVMPFITEEIWQRLVPALTMQLPENASIMQQPFPQVQQDLIDEDAEADIDWLKTMVQGIRNIRGEMNIAPGKKIQLLLTRGCSQDRQRIAEHQVSLERLARVNNITWLAANDSAPAAATVLVGELEVLVPMAGLIDSDAETARLTKAITKVEQDLKLSNTKLGNPNYVERAPAAVVEKEREKVGELQAKLTKLRQQLDKITAIAT